MYFLIPFYHRQDEVADSVRDYACLEDVVPLVAILDLAEGSKFLLEEGVEVSTATVHNFVTRCITGLICRCEDTSVMSVVFYLLHRRLTEFNNQNSVDFPHALSITG